jgi:hypothetical protein
MINLKLKILTHILQKRHKIKIKNVTIIGLKEQLNPLNSMINEKIKE